MVLGLAVVLFAYLLGSMLFGVALSKWLKGVDIRSMDNPGGTGSIRKFGWRFGVMAGVLDALKGVAVAHIAHVLTGNPAVVILSAMAVVVGHNWPVYFSFRGGGGLAPAFGVIIYHFPFEFAVGLVPAFLMLALYKRTPLRKWLPFIGPVPIISVLGLLTTLTLVWQRHGFFPESVLIMAMGVPIAIGGYVMLLRDRRRKQGVNPAGERGGQVGENRAGAK